MSRKPTLPLDVRTIRWAARKAELHARLALSSSAAGMLSGFGSYLRTEARAIERKRHKLTPAPRESKAKRKR